MLPTKELNGNNGKNRKWFQDTEPVWNGKVQAVLSGCNPAGRSEDDLFRRSNHASRHLGVAWLRLGHCQLAPQELLGASMSKSDS